MSTRSIAASKLCAQRATLRSWRGFASGWAVLGDPQVLRGYCLLLPDPVVAHLNDLSGRARSQFLDDMARLGDAVGT